MADDSSSSILVPESGTTEIESTTLASKKRQVLRVAGRATGEYADVRAANPATADYGVVVRLPGQLLQSEADSDSYPSVKIGLRASDGPAGPFSNDKRIDARANYGGALAVAPESYICGLVMPQGAAGTAARVKRKVINALTISTTQNLFAGVASNYVYVIGVVLGCTTASGVVTFEQQTSGADLMCLRLQADLAPVAIWAPMGQFLFASTAVADGLNLVGQTNQVATGMVYYFTSTASIT